MKVLVTFSSKDRPELTKRTAEALFKTHADGAVSFDVDWHDGSTDEEALKLPGQYRPEFFSRTPGSNPDSIYLSAINRFITVRREYSHLAFLENDVLVHPDWLMRCLELFEIGHRDGLLVGATTARTYRERVLIQRDKYAIMHNIGAGCIVMSRPAVNKLQLSYRTGHTMENRHTFAMLANVNIGGFIDPSWPWGMDNHHITADWSWDAVFGRHGFASLGLVPSMAEMIDQPIEPLGLSYASEPVESRRSTETFDTFLKRTTLIREGKLTLPFGPLLRTPPEVNDTMVVFPHQFHRLDSSVSKDQWAVKWEQGFGPFAFVSKSDQARIELKVMGYAIVVCETLPGQTGRLLLSDDVDPKSYRPQMSPGPRVGVHLPGSGNVYRTISIQADGPGAVVYGVMLNPQPLHYSSGSDTPREFWRSV